MATQLLALVPTTATALGLGAVLAVGCLLVINGSISLGTVVAAQAFAVLLLEALHDAGVVRRAVPVGHQRRGSRPTLSCRTPLDPEVIEHHGLRRLGPAPARGALSIGRLAFGYDREADPLIADLTIDVAAGRRMALVGSSGSGKTTIARLVDR